ncbi:hypothetical protein ACFL43_03145 [Thermodesulfobacteriota bacterium]
MTPPPTDAETLMSDFGVVFKQYLLYFLGAVAFMVIMSQAGIGAGILFAVLAMVGLPAMIILLVVNESLVDALNPVKVSALISRIGNGYLIMWFFIFLLGGAPAVLSNYVLPILPSFLQLLVVGMAQKYYTIISYHLMGYVLLQ